MAAAYVEEPAKLPDWQMRKPLALIPLLVILVSILAPEDVTCAEGDGVVLFAAIAESDCAEIRSLLDDGANVSARDEIDATPLMRALEKNLALNCVLTLIRAGADPNATHGSLKISMLMVAASYSTAEVVSLLLESGAKVDFATPDGWTALMSAARNSSRPEVIRELVAAGANINALDRYGVTPLMRAVQTNQNTKIIEALVRLGADPTLETSDGHTAYALAKDAGRGREVLAILAPDPPKDEDLD